MSRSGRTSRAPPASACPHRRRLAGRSPAGDHRKGKCRREVTPFFLRRSEVSCRQLPEAGTAMNAILLSHLTVAVTALMILTELNPAASFAAAANPAATREEIDPTPSPEERLKRNQVSAVTGIG